MDCEKAKNLIPDLLDGALDARTAGAIRAHCGTCPSCGAELKLSELIALSVESLPESDPGPGFTAAVMAVIEPETRRAAAPSEVSAWAFWGTGALAGAILGGCALAATAGLFFGGEFAARFPELQLGLLKGAMAARNAFGLAERFLGVLLLGIDAKSLIAPLVASPILAGGFLTILVKPYMEKT